MNEDKNGTEVEKNNHTAAKGARYMNVSMATLEPDWFLRKLVGFANDFGIETSVTLQVGGVQVTGMIISGERYFRLTAEEFGNAFSSSDLRDSFKALLNDFAESVKSQPVVEGEDRPDPSYIHLNNAHLYSPGGSIPINQGKPILWRARISAVDGFYIGSAAKAVAPGQEAS